MSQFDTPLNGFRFARINHGDTLQKIALRELGDASLWANLVYLNDLVPPYITDNPALASSQVLLSGSMMMLPAASQQIATDPKLIYGVDCQLNGGDLVADNGDFALVAGEDNLKQALGNLLVTEPGEAMFYPRYGCKSKSLIGQKNMPMVAMLAAQFAKEALQSDPRVKTVATVTATVAGDALQVDAVVNPVTGVSVPISASV